MPRQITYSIATEYRNGYYNPTFNWGVLDRGLNYLGLYWDIQFVRTNSGRIKFIQAQTNPNSSWAAWTRGMEARISPVFDFGRDDYLTAKVACHEFGHMCRPGGAHAKSPGMMDPNGSMPTGNLAPVDYWWFDVYAKKPGTKRPHEEPNRMRSMFPALARFAATEPATLEFGCDHTPTKRPWYDLRPESWIRP